MTAAPTPYDSTQTMNKDSFMVAADYAEKQQKKQITGAPTPFDSTQTMNDSYFISFTASRPQSIFPPKFKNNFPDILLHPTTTAPPSPFFHCYPTHLEHQLKTDTDLPLSNYFDIQTKTSTFSSFVNKG